MEQRGARLDCTLQELTISSTADSAAVPGSSATLELKDRRLVCVEYPGVVRNEDVMLQTLGGEQTLSSMFSNPNRRLELRFRPKDPFCHPLCGNRFPSSNLLLKVRRRVRKNDPKNVKIHMDFLGVIGTTYKFQGMADFQCLAVHSENGKETSLYDKIVLRKSENKEFFEQPYPSFLPPATFSRLDSPVDYYYRPDVIIKQVMPNSKSVIGLNRARRPHNAIFVTFNETSIPSQCLEAAKKNWIRISLKEGDRLAEENLRQMFESRPIWSRNAVKANINIHPEKLKLLLPVVAYYMVTGPWRSLWVRLGYDPRKTTQSKMYQMLDFRIRCSTKHGYSLSDLPVKPKRSALNYNLSITFNKTAPPPASLTELPAQTPPSTSEAVTYQLKDSSYIFQENMLPPHRQMFYQLCDLHVDSVRELINRNDGSESVCDERDGWCVIGTTDLLREIISNMVKKVIRANRPSVPEPPQKHRRKRQSCRQEDEEEDDDYEDEDDDEDDDEFHPSEGSENEMETEMLDYMTEEQTSVADESFSADLS
ncbi:general transcription factor 3C polypeptide 5 [Neosynchiropus ocellatus]